MCSMKLKGNQLSVHRPGAGGVELCGGKPSGPGGGQEEPVLHRRSHPRGTATSQHRSNVHPSQNQSRRHLQGLLHQEGWLFQNISHYPDGVVFFCVKRPFFPARTPPCFLCSPLFCTTRTNGRALTLLTPPTSWIKRANLERGMPSWPSQQVLH